MVGEEAAAAAAVAVAADADADGTAESAAAALVHTTTTGTAYPLTALTDSLRAYARGPADLADPFVREKITHFDHERGGEGIAAQPPPSPNPTLAVAAMVAAFFLARLSQSC
ncbi:hypothetical protein HK405_000899 [Cladochytrium tenue]|nr:hypothetical protein HK405_000899 [Cladochytrium tenue]